MIGSQITFIDSNVWLYSLIEDASSPEKQAIAIQSINSSSSIVISTQVINEVCVNLIKKTGASEAQISQLIKSFYRRCRIIDQTQDVLIEGSRLRQRYQISFWDSLIISCALRGGATTLLSEDLQSGQRIDDRLEIFNPFTGSIGS